MLLLCAINLKIDDMKNLVMTGSKLWLGYIAEILSKMVKANTSTNINQPNSKTNQELEHRYFYLMRYRRFY